MTDKEARAWLASALWETAKRVEARHGMPFAIRAPSNDNWLFEEEGA